MELLNEEVENAIKLGYRIWRGMVQDSDDLREYSESSGTIRGCSSNDIDYVKL